MTEEPSEQSEMPPFPEAATPGRSMHGAAEDLSTLFGDEADERDLGHTALGPARRPPPSPATDASSRMGPALEAITARISALGTELTDAVERIQSVDRHLASTYQTLQSVLQRLPEEGSAPGAAAPVDLGPLAERIEVLRQSVHSVLQRLPEAGSGLGAAAPVDLGPLTGRIEVLRQEVTRAAQLAADQVERLGERLTGLESDVRAIPASSAAAPLGNSTDEPDRLAALEVALTATSERLSVLEERVGATLSHAEASRKALTGLEQGFAELRGELSAPAPGRPEPDRDEGAPTDDIDALLALRPTDRDVEPPTEPEPAGPAHRKAQEALIWSSTGHEPHPAEPEVSEPVEDLSEPQPEAAPAAPDAGVSGNGRVHEPEVEPDRPDTAPLWPVPDEPPA